MSQEPVILKVKLPPSSPVISKTFKVPPTATVHSAVSDVIGKSLQQTVSVNSNYGLYLPNQKQWLDDGQLISEVQSAISSEEYVELKERRKGQAKSPVLATNELIYGLGGFLIGVVATLLATRSLA